MNRLALRPARLPSPVWTLVVASAAVFMCLLDALVVTTALPVLKTSLHGGLPDLEWTVNAYNLSFACLLLTGAVLGDRFGRRRMLCAGLAVFTVASATAALSPGIGVLIAGGVVVQSIGWRWIFWLNVFIGLALIPMAALKVRESFGGHPRLDLAGLTLASAGLFGIVWGLVRAVAAGWASGEVIGALAGGAVVTAGFLLWERRSASPMLSLAMFRQPRWTTTASVDTTSTTATPGDMMNRDNKWDRTRAAFLDYPEALREFMGTGWRQDRPAARPQPEAPDYARRRAALSAAFPGETLVIPTGTAKARANDQCYPFRPGSDFAYLTGDHDPDGVLIMRPGGDGHEVVVYTRPPSLPSSEEFFWDLMEGRPRAPAEKAAELGVQMAALAEVEDALASCAPARTRVLRGLDGRVDASVLPSGPGDGAARDRELAAAIAELKLVKDEWEIAQLQDAIDATVRGFEDVARVVPADRGVSERLIEGVFGLRARHDGNDVGYGSIVGAGAHSATSGWQVNSGATAPGDLLLMDMGVENNHLYTADITRTVPVSGAFTRRAEKYRSGELGEGYVLTVEPGLYFQPDDDLVPPELRGIGIRIEDDILVTTDGTVNLSAGLPRKASDVESWLAAQREAGPRLAGVR